MFVVLRRHVPKLDHVRCMSLCLRLQVALIAKGDAEFDHVLNVTNREYRAVKQALVSEDHTRAAIVAEEVSLIFILFFFSVCCQLPSAPMGSIHWPRLGKMDALQHFLGGRCILTRNTSEHSKNAY